MKNLPKHFGPKAVRMILKDSQVPKDTALGEMLRSAKTDFLTFRAIEALRHHEPKKALSLLIIAAKESTKFLPNLAKDLAVLKGAQDTYYMMRAEEHLLDDRLGWAILCCVYAVYMMEVADGSC